MISITIVAIIIMTIDNTIATINIVKKAYY